MWVVPNHWPHSLVEQQRKWRSWLMWLNKLQADFVQGTKSALSWLLIGQNEDGEFQGRGNTTLDWVLSLQMACYPLMPIINFLKRQEKSTYLFYVAMAATLSSFLKIVHPLLHRVLYLLCMACRVVSYMYLLPCCYDACCVLYLLKCTRMIKAINLVKLVSL